MKQLGAGSYLGLQITTQPLSDLLQFGPIQRMRRAGRAPISDIILKFQFTYHPWSAAIQLSEHPAMHNRENAAKIAAISSLPAKIEICAALLLIFFIAIRLENFVLKRFLASVSKENSKKSLT